MVMAAAAAAGITTTAKTNPLRSTTVMSTAGEAVCQTGPAATMESTMQTVNTTMAAAVADGVGKRF